MKVITEEAAGVLVLKISGGIHCEAAKPLKEALLDHLCTQESLVIDLTGVDMCDTASLQVLAALKRSAAGLGKQCRIEMSPEVLETIDALGFPNSLIAEGLSNEC